MLNQVHIWSAFTKRGTQSAKTFATANPFVRMPAKLSHLNANESSVSTAARDSLSSCTWLCFPLLFGPAWVPTSFSHICYRHVIIWGFSDTDPQRDGLGCFFFNRGRSTGKEASVSNVLNHLKRKPTLYLECFHHFTLPVKQLSLMGHWSHNNSDFTLQNEGVATQLLPRSVSLGYYVTLVNPNKPLNKTPKSGSFEVSDMTASAPRQKRLSEGKAKRWKYSNILQ